MKVITGLNNEYIIENDDGDILTDDDGNTLRFGTITEAEKYINYLRG